MFKKTNRTKFFIFGPFTATYQEKFQKWVFKAFSPKTQEQLLFMYKLSSKDQHHQTLIPIGTIFPALELFALIAHLRKKKPSIEKILNNYY